MKKILTYLSVFILGAVSTMFTGIVLAQTSISFPDVKPDAWYYQDVMNMVSWDVIRGNDDGTFKPENNVNRAELSAMWNRYENHINERLPENVYMDIELSTVYMELAWIYFHMAEQYRVNNLVYSDSLGSGMSLPCDRIEGLKDLAEVYLERAIELSPSALSQDDIDWMMGEFDSTYNNCLEWITVEGL